MPFAGFKDFGACVRSAAAKGVKNPKAYCAAIKRKTEDKREADLVAIVLSLERYIAA